MARSLGGLRGLKGGRSNSRMEVIRPMCEEGWTRGTRGDEDVQVGKERDLKNQKLSSLDRDDLCVLAWRRDSQKGHTPRSQAMRQFAHAGNVWVCWVCLTQVSKPAPPGPGPMAAPPTPLSPVETPSVHLGPCSPAVPLDRLCQEAHLVQRCPRGPVSPPRPEAPAAPAGPGGT